MLNSVAVGAIEAGAIVATGMLDSTSGVLGSTTGVLNSVAVGVIEAGAIVAAGVLDSTSGVPGSTSGVFVED